ncbi:MAG: alpha/beta fold hydrolase [Gemmatimonadetes bacterium]|nr:alpha/beta fold hydrolase [Gemmatimonadota bacterium]
MRSIVPFAALVLVAPFAGAQARPVQHVVVNGAHRLALWEKRPPNPRRAIVLLHGRTWSALPDFDLQVPGERRSFMDALVARGYAVYALDLPGYGKSPRDASGWNTPESARSDLVAALRWVADSSGVRGKPALFGWSLGSTTSHFTVQAHPELVSALILFGYPPGDRVSELSPLDTIKAPLRLATTAEAAAEDFIRPDVMSKKAIAAYVKAALAADPVKSDWHRTEQWRALDPAKVTVPTLLLQGEFDPIGSTEAGTPLFTRLGTGERQWVVIAGGDHAALMEDTQPAMVAAMVAFLERPRRK